MIKMRKYKVKYNLVISNTALQSANNKFELHKKISDILNDLYKQVLKDNKVFKSAFAGGKHKIVMEIRKYNEKDN